MPKFEHGQAKPAGSGRKRGTPNKNTQRLGEILDSAAFNVPERLVKLLPKLSRDKQADILVSLLTYLHPKPKPEDNVCHGPIIQRVILSLPPKDPEPE